MPLPPIETRIQTLLAPASALAKGDDIIWKGHGFIWKAPETWMPQMTAWLEPRFRSAGWKKLSPGKFRDITCDDTEWLEVLQDCLKVDLDTCIDDLTAALAGARLWTYHGCRTEDAGLYFRDGLQRHDRQTMTRRLYDLVDGHETLAWLKPSLEQKIARTDNTIDLGRLYVVVDDDFMIETAGHYLIYGSEWILAVLGQAAHQVLKSIGVPTLLEIDLPLDAVASGDRREFAADLLMEWTRRACNVTDWHTPLNFTFCLEQDIPPAWIVGHSHPARIEDQFDDFRAYVSPRSTCRHCEPQS